MEATALALKPVIPTAIWALLDPSISIWQKHFKVKSQHFKIPSSPAACRSFSLTYWDHCLTHHEDRNYALSITGPMAVPAVHQSKSDSGLTLTPVRAALSKYSHDLRSLQPWCHYNAIQHFQIYWQGVFSPLCLSPTVYRHLHWRCCKLPPSWYCGITAVLCQQWVSMTLLILLMSLVDNIWLALTVVIGSKTRSLTCWCWDRLSG